MRRSKGRASAQKEAALRRTALLRGKIRRPSNEAAGLAITRLTRIVMHYVAAEETSSIAAASAILPM